MRRLKTYKGIVVVKQGAAESDPFAILVAAFKSDFALQAFYKVTAFGKNCTSYFTGTATGSVVTDFVCSQY